MTLATVGMLIGAVAATPPPGSAAAASAVRYEIAAEVAPATHELSVRTVLTAETLAPTSTIRVFLHEELRVQSVRLGSQALDVTVRPRSEQSLPFSPTAVPIDIALPSAAPAGERLRLEILYGGVVSGTIDSVNLISEPLTELALYAAWYPVLSGSREFTYELQASLPKGYVVVGDGERDSESGDGGGERTVVRFRRTQPGSDIVLIAARDLKHLERRRAGFAVEVYSRDLPEATVAQIADAAAEGYALLERELGTPAVGGRMLLVASPRGGWGYSRVPLAVFSEGYARKQLENPEGAFEILHGNLHEVAHYWWRLADSGTSDDWINESLAEWSALHACETLFGRKPVARVLAQYEEDVRELKDARAITETLRTDAPAYVLFYERGALLWESLRRQAGSERLLSVLRGVHAAHRSGPVNLTTAELLSSVAAGLGEPVAGVLRQGITTAPGAGTSPAVKR